jgi:hypothetical protein
MSREDKPVQVEGRSVITRVWEWEWGMTDMAMRNILIYIVAFTMNLTNGYWSFCTEMREFYGVWVKP